MINYSEPDFHCQKERSMLLVRLSREAARMHDQACSEVHFNDTLHCLNVSSLVLDLRKCLLLQTLRQGSNVMSRSIKLFCIAHHKFDVSEECSRLLVLVSLRLVLHVFQGDRAADQIAIVRCILPCRLLLE
jgi:hypothetical protein